MFEYILKEPKVMEKVGKDIPDLDPDEVLIKVKYVGICGSDIHLYNGTYSGPHNYPMLLGHEWAGEVVCIGKDVTKVQKGNIVTGDCSKYCDSCIYCETDKNLCKDIEKFGITIDGATAEYIVRNQKYLYKCDDVVDEKLLCLSEPIAVAAHLISKILNVSSGDISKKNILVMGGGVIGMSAMLLLKNMYGCEHVSLYDLSEHRINIAKKLGAEIPSPDSLNVKVEGGSYSALYEAARYDVVLETTGASVVFANAFNFIKPGGILGSVGMISSVEIPQKLIVTKALTVIGAIGGTGDFPMAMKFIADYPEKAKLLISHYFPMDEIENAFLMARKPDESMKVVLEI